MAKRRDQLIGVLDRYIDEVSSEPASLEDVARWGYEQRLYSPPPQDIIRMFKNDLADALRQEKRYDGKRWYRSKHSIRTSVGGTQLVLWADIDKNASHSFMRKSTADRRKGVADDAFQLKMIVDHYNEAHPSQPQIQLERISACLNRGGFPFGTVRDSVFLPAGEAGMDDKTIFE